MSMMSIMDFMGDDHDRLDKIFSEFKRTDDIIKAKELFNEFKIGLQRHIVWEEEILFSMFETKNNIKMGMHTSSPTAMLRMDHSNIIEFLNQFNNRIKAGELPDNDFENWFLEILKSHNEREEDIVYPGLDDVLGIDELRATITKMQNVPKEKYEVDELKNTIRK